MGRIPKWPELSIRLADDFAAKAREKCLIAGIAGAQGSGKTSLAHELVDALQARGKRAALLSLDDYYLSSAKRQRLADTVHPMLKVRGVPGTHHVEQLLDDVAQAKAGAGELHVPVFDKLADDVSGEKRTISLPLDVLIVEGWCLGAQPQSGAELSSPVNALERKQDREMVWRRFVNDALKADYARLNAALDELVFLEIPDFDLVVQWREQAEREAYAARDQKPPKDLHRQMCDFVAYYERITRFMLQGGIKPTCTVKLDAQRRMRVGFA